ncbi:cadherin domain-containing protein [Mangrovivirga sp. M17]|uniref:Cadherin domain-containing protein n=1 Tax=Mangrovivirga halotolerans TaxID=2993936 RepID=A0ABT3RL01_9BACT|nr:cadherin domain-containing protein [Mangrovivirga halotolerans]MCX2742384.1 cadherin domain-containing protein [Mangrovivirga halotolerans]
MYRYIFLLAIVILIGTEHAVNAQSPGEIIQPSSDAGIDAILDPNGDGWITNTGSAFTGTNESSEFELNFIGIPGPNEINGDAIEGGDCGNYDFVTGQDQTGLYYYYLNPDSAINTADDGVIFRARSGDLNSNDVSLHVLIESNPDHAGFDREISISTYTFFGFQLQLKSIFNLETGQETNVYENVFQHSLANPNAGSCVVPVFTDMYFDLSEIGISADQDIKITTVIARNRNNWTGAINATSSVFDKEISDIYNVDDSGITDINSGLAQSISGYQYFTLAGEPPVINTTDANVDENAPVGTEVITVDASDPDNDNLLFKIIGGNINNAFTIDKNTGLITVTNPAAIDYETNPTFELIIEVRDRNGNKVQGTITITVNNVNEPPSISGTDQEIDENADAGLLLTTLILSDPENNIETVEITGGNINNAFLIDSDGNIKVNNSSAINFEETPEFNLEITVTDIRGLTAIITIKVTVIDINEPPTTDSKFVEVVENSPVNTIVSELLATDPDGNFAGFEIIGGDGADYFNLSADGTLTVGDASVLNHEVNPEFTIIVRVVDEEGLGSEAQITIKIGDIPEPPAISASDETVEENSPNGTLITTAIVTDPENNVLRLFITNPDTPFGIRNNGEIYVANQSLLDFESQQSWTLQLGAIDNTDLEGSTSITITVLNINEAPSADTLFYEVLGGEMISDNIVKYLSDPENDPVNLSSTGSIQSDFGTITYNNTGFEYLANNCSSGTDYISYKACDNGSLCAESILAITVIVMDSDEDGIPDHIEIGEDINNPLDSDEDGTPDYLSTDSDGDDIPDSEEAGSDPCNPADFNNNGILDYREEEIVIKPLKPTKGFSPNGDGNNDFWTIEGIGEFPQNRVEIYNRWGNLIYQATGYDNFNVRWEGQNTELNLGGEGAPDGTYFYFLYIEGSSKPLQGFLVLKR